MHPTKPVLATIPWTPESREIKITNLSLLAFSLASPVVIITSYKLDAVADAVALGLTASGCIYLQ